MANYGTVIIQYKFVTSMRGNGVSFLLQQGHNGVKECGRGNGVSFLTNLSSAGSKWRERTWKSCRLCAMSRNSDSSGWQSYLNQYVCGEMIIGARSIKRILILTVSVIVGMQHQSPQLLPDSRKESYFDQVAVIRYAFNCNCNCNLFTFHVSHTGINTTDLETVLCYQNKIYNKHMPFGQQSKSPTIPFNSMYYSIVTIPLDPDYN